MIGFLFAALLVVFIWLIYIVIRLGDQSTKINTLQYQMQRLQGKHAPAKRVDDTTTQDEVVPSSLSVTEQPSQQDEIIFPETVDYQTSDASVGQQLDGLTTTLKNFVNSDIMKKFLTGNPIAKIGMLILFVGVAFLIKYVTINFYVPISYRLMAVACLGIGLMMFSIPLFSINKVYAGILAGGGTSILYLTIYSAATMYLLLAPVTAILLMVVTSLVSASLAFNKNSRGLMLISMVGGFLAPLLIESGSGRIGLVFCYYMLLNVAILVTVYYKKWNELSVVGFLFTFLVSALWGNRSYRHELFWLAETYLIGFTVVYIVNTCVMRMQSAALKLSGIEITVLFATPVIYYLLQNEILSLYVYGQVINALVLAGVYAALALIANKKRRLTLLTIPFSAIALVSLTIAIPLACTLIATIWLWSIEAALLLWYGLRTSNNKVQIAGLVLLVMTNIVWQKLWFFDPVISVALHASSAFSNIELVYLLLGGMTSVIDIVFKLPSTMNFSHLIFGGLIVSLSNISCSYFLFLDKRLDVKWLSTSSIILLVMAVLGWYQTNVYGIYEYVGAIQYELLLVLVITTHLLACLGADFFSWKALKSVSLALLPALVMMGILTFTMKTDSVWAVNLIWLYGLVSLYYIYYRCECFPEEFLESVHRVTGVFVVMLVTSRAYLLSHAYYLQPVISDLIIIGLVPAIILQIINCQAFKSYWPLNKYHQAYQGIVGSMIATYLFVWLLCSNFSSGMGVGQLYLPIFNVLGLTIVAVVIIAGYWYSETQAWINRQVDVSDLVYLKILFAVVVFALC